MYMHNYYVDDACQPNAATCVTEVSIIFTLAEYLYMFKNLLLSTYISMHPLNLFSYCTCPIMEIFFCM